MNLFRAVNTNFNVQSPIPFISLVQVQLLCLIAVFFHVPYISQKDPHLKFPMIPFTITCLLSCSGPQEMSCLVQISLFCLQIQPEMIPLQDFAHCFSFQRHLFFSCRAYYSCSQPNALLNVPRVESGLLQSFFPPLASFIFQELQQEFWIFHQYVINIQAWQLLFFICIFYFLQNRTEGDKIKRT